jgi:RIO-like serine/threonine protein kinase
MCRAWPLEVARDVQKLLNLFKKKKKQRKEGKKSAKCLAVISKVTTFAIAIQK